MGTQRKYLEDWQIPLAPTKLTMYQTAKYHLATQQLMLNALFIYFISGSEDIDRKGRLATHTTGFSYSNKDNVNGFTDATIAHTGAIFPTWKK